MNHLQPARILWGSSLHDILLIVTVGLRRWPSMAVASEAFLPEPWHGRYRAFMARETGCLNGAWKEGWGGQTLCEVVRATVKIKSGGHEPHEPISTMVSPIAIESCRVLLNRSVKWR